ncbi:MAG: hypothetical protein LBD73_00205 [Deferribacteraceae bacterium]|jgi:hypothetical protein|nr:hypothetical protein [Deferribacteraceae bacterium]
MSEITFKITKKIAVLSVSSRGWSKELNLVEWNGRAAKLDIREWSPDHDKMGKGVTVSYEEAKILLEALKELFS